LAFKGRDGRTALKTTLTTLRNSPDLAEPPAAAEELLEVKERQPTEPSNRAYTEGSAKACQDEHCYTPEGRTVLLCWKKNPKSFR
jgi:hypothetical protein